jgi:hypothetical protein
LFIQDQEFHQVLGFEFQTIPSLHDLCYSWIIRPSFTRVFFSWTIIIQKFLIVGMQKEIGE